MSRRKFLTDYRTQIDATIRAKHGMQSYADSLNDTDRWVWILNDEGLYNFARSVGVKV